MGRKIEEYIVNFISRAIIGLGIIFLANQFLEYQGISVSVGLNLISFLTSGILGIPGIGLLYSVLFYRIL